MSNIFRIDVHTHAFHPKIAAKACAQLESHYKIKLTGDGTWADLEPRLDKCGLDRAIVLSAATTPHQVTAANNWAISLKANPRIIPFGTMHPGFENVEQELARLWEAGIRGIKLHPDFQGFRLDDPALDRLFGAMEGRFTLMLHVGDVLPPAENPSCPYKCAAIKRKYPRLQMIAAHFGGYQHWKYVVDAMAGLDIYMDTSSALFAIPQELLEGIWRAFPRHLFLFGSDYPLWDALSERNVLQQRLRLTDTELEEILTNGSRLGL